MHEQPGVLTWAPQSGPSCSVMAVHPCMESMLQLTRSMLLDTHLCVQQCLLLFVHGDVFFLWAIIHVIRMIDFNILQLNFPLVSMTPYYTESTVSETILWYADYWNSAQGLLACGKHSGVLAEQLVEFVSVSSEALAFAENCTLGAWFILLSLSTAASLVFRALQSSISSAPVV